MANHPFDGVSFADVIRMPNGELDDIMTHGETPVAEHLEGSEFRGYNPPLFARLLGFQKFMKGFWVDDAGHLAGYNLFVEGARKGPDAPWQPKNGGRPQDRHGYYDVEAVSASGRYTDFPNAVLLDYGSGRNARFNPESRIRDFLVQVDPSNGDLYLGKAYIDLGLFRVFSNYFVLERLRDTP